MLERSQEVSGQSHKFLPFSEVKDFCSVTLNASIKRTVVQLKRPEWNASTAKYFTLVKDTTHRSIRICNLLA